MSNEGGSILTKLEQSTFRSNRKPAPLLTAENNNTSLDNSNSYYPGFLSPGPGRCPREGICKQCPHCQANSLEMHKVKLQLKPFFERLSQESNGKIDLPEYILNMEKLKDYFKRDSIEGDASKYFDLAIELLISGKLDLKRIVDGDLLKKLKEISLFNGMSFLNRKDIDDILIRVKNILDKSEHMRETIKQGNESLESESANLYAKMKKKLACAKVPNENDLNSAALFTCIQELIREFTLTSKERGNLLLRALSGFFQENENKWLGIVDIFLDNIQALELELASLIKAMSFRISDVDQALNDTKPTPETLVTHQKLIRTLLANLYCERSKRITLEAEIELLKQEINTWVLQWEDLKKCSRIKEKIQGFTYEIMQETFPSHKHLEDEEKILTFNIERFLLALPGKFRFDEERNNFKKTLDEKDAEISRLQQLIEALKEENKEVSFEKNHLAEKIMGHEEFTKKALSKLKFVETSDKETQIDPEILLQQKDTENELNDKNVFC